MVIRGNGEKKLISGFIVFIVLASIWSNHCIRVLSILGVWIIFYFTCIWIREIWITDCQIIIKRFMRQVTINKGQINGVEFKKHTIIIYNGRYSALNFSKYQIQKGDLPKLMEYLSRYTYSK